MGHGRPDTVEQNGQRWGALASLMDERMRRPWAASEAQTYGWGDVSAVSGAVGMSPKTSRRELAELLEIQAHPGGPVTVWVRRRVGGRKCATLID